MCGRFTLLQEKEEIEARFDAKLEESIEKMYNAAPSQQLPIIPNTEPDSIKLFHWGFLPFWGKKRSDGIINAKGETVHEKPTFKTSFQQRRCLIPADGFYEWKKTGNGKVPYRITLKDQSLFAMAGIWRKWTDKETGEVLPTFSIITTQPNDFMKKIHNRMPVILSPDQERQWLSEKAPAEELKALIGPYPGNEMKAHPVSKKVNSPAHNTADILKPEEGRLF